jgi:hypothetical protein
MSLLIKRRQSKKEKLTTAHAPPVYRQANISASRFRGGGGKKKEQEGKNP